MRRRLMRWSPWIVLLACAAVAVKLLVPSRVVFRNQLVVPVEVRIDHDPPVRVILQPGAGWSSRMAGIPGASWHALVPAGDSLLRVGELRGGRFPEPATPLLLQRLLYLDHVREINPHQSGRRFFAPLITNQSAGAVSVAITDRTGVELPCECVIHPAARRTFVGYFGALPARITITPVGRGMGRPITVDVDERMLGPSGAIEVLVPDAAEIPPARIRGEGG